MFRLKRDGLQKDLRRVEGAAAAFNDANRVNELMTILGVQLLSFVQQDYVTKSRGGTGADGTKWKPLAKSTIDRKSRRGRRNRNRTRTRSGRRRPHGNATAIGIDTGLQLASASPGHPDNVFDVGGSSVTVGFNRTYSEYFNEERPLIPEQLPEPWEAELELHAQDWGDNILREFF